MQSRKYEGRVAWILWVIASAPAFAQTAPVTAGGGMLKEIVVTATKSAEDLQHAAASISVVSSSQLTSEGIGIPSQLSSELANANLTTEGAVAQVFIRGVGSRVDFPWTSPASAITYNGIVIPRYGTMGLMFDLSSVQEIAGPQGTLYGGSAAGGAINLITERPGNDWSGDGLIGIGNYGAQQVAIDQDVPASSTVSARTSISYSRHEGYETGELDSSNMIKGRESLLFTPTGNLRALFFVSGYRENAPQGDQSVLNLKPMPSDPWNRPMVGVAGNPVYGLPRDNRTYVAGGNIEWHVGPGTFTYIPGYVHILDAYQFWSTHAGSDSSILNVYDGEVQNSQELRWNGQLGAVKLIGGLFWLQDDIHFRDGISIAELPASRGYYVHVPVIDRTQQKNTSDSAYFSATYSFSAQLRLTVGGRESQDKISAVGSGHRGAFTFNHSQNTADWKVGVDYDVTQEVMLYADAQTSYVPFGYDPDVGTPAELLPEAHLRGYSTGVKSRLLDDSLEVNDEFYYYDYSDYQAFAVDHATNLTQAASAKRSVIYGDQLDVRWALPLQMRFDGSIDAQSAHYTDFTGPGFDYSGYAMEDAPDLKAVLRLQHSTNLRGKGDLLERVSTQYNSGFWGDFTHTGTWLGSYWKTNLSLTYLPEVGRWSLQAFVNNVGNVATLNGAGVNAPPLPGSGALAPPRTYGLRISSHW